MANIKNIIKNITKKKKNTKEETKDEEVKKEEEIRKPKAFEEFDIEQSVLDELDALPSSEEENKEVTSSDDNVSTEELKEEEPSKEELEAEIVELLPEEYNKGKKPNLADINSQEYTAIIRDNIQFCTDQIKEISSSMADIEKQKGSESFWKKSENIKTISRYVSKVSDVQQKTLDLLVLLLGASGRMVDDYDTIMQTIDELSELNGGEAEVLNYLLKVKKMIKEIKDNDQRLKDIMYNNEVMAKKIDDFEKVIDKYNKDMVTRINSFNGELAKERSKNRRLETKLNRNSFIIFLAFLVIAILAVVLYVKVF